MKKLFFIMSLALMAVFVVVSCSNEDEFAQEQQKDQPLTTENIQSMQNFVRSFARFHKNTTPIVEKRMARTRSTAADNQRDIEAIQQQVEMLGESAQQMFMEIGFTEQELNNLCPLENREVYALVGVQMLSVMANQMPEIIDDCPEEPGDEELSMAEQVQYAGECLSAVIGFDIMKDFASEIAPAIVKEGVSKKVLKEAMERGVVKIVTRFAGKIAAGPGAILGEWAACMFIRKIGWRY